MALKNGIFTLALSALLMGSTAMAQEAQTARGMVEAKASCLIMGSRTASALDRLNPGDASLSSAAWEPGSARSRRRYARLFGSPVSAFTTMIRESLLFSPLADRHASKAMSFPSLDQVGDRCGR